MKEKELDRDQSRKDHHVDEEVEHNESDENVGGFWGYGISDDDNK
jgi:hypothetical protein